MKNKKVFFEDWGLMPYEQAWDKQETIFAETVAIKTANRNHPETAARS